ncbi:hypothetical protein [Siccirubricoccus sp. G192]|uniref:hypothetical protein n=1 Tax=Siccirubricoccus sp. G192 TaxID=2849651 RepID=UPI001C2C4D40|nr:hypothetical protein [Siccirubricoccus sp. G192]MBV1797484.1 hypothetical protein [Siccirubricoccus sp. G192]
MKAGLLATAVMAGLFGTASLALAQGQPGSMGTGPGSPSPQGQVITEPPPEPSLSMDRLQRATEDLRKAIQAMAEQPAGDRRNEAMRTAERAILETQESMVQLPASLRTSQEYRDTQAQFEETHRLLRDRNSDPQQTKAAADRLAEHIPRLKQQGGNHATGTQGNTPPASSGGTAGQPAPHR